MSPMVHEASISDVLLIRLHCVLCYTEWTTEGCETDLAEVDGGVVTCRCTHLTNFAILVVSIPSMCVCISMLT